MTIESTAKGSVHSSADLRRRLLIRHAYAASFPAAEYNSYEAFLNVHGESIKSESRTRVVILRRRPSAAPEKTIDSFVLKIYRYPLLPRIRTGFRISKAEQEFNSLSYLNQQGVPAAEPVAFGVERTRLGLVRSCFLITGLVEGAVNLSQRRSESAQQARRELARDQLIFRRLGTMLRRLHELRFFLFTAKTKNLLVRDGPAASPEIFFVDVPYARTLRWRPIARWAQGRDLGLLLGNFFPALTEAEKAWFYEAYLPDPLGGSAAALSRHAERAMRSKQNLTPISALVHGLKRRLRKKPAATVTRTKR